MSFRLPPTVEVIERGWLSSNNIVLTGPDEAVVVDTGYSSHAQQTVALVQRALAGRELSRIINTHTHSDHIGGNAALLRAYPRAQIAIPVGDARAVREWDEAALHLTTMGHACERFGFDSTIAAGELLSLGGLAWRAVDSPGHHMASLMLHAEEPGILLSADALWQNGFGVIFPEVDGEQVSQGEAFAAQRATLEAISALKVNCVVPGHGAPFTEVDAALERAFGRIDYFVAHPERHARNGAKVALSFMLMMEGAVALAQVPQRLCALPLIESINRAYYQMAPAALAEFIVAELEKSGAAHRSDGWLKPGRA